MGVIVKPFWVKWAWEPTISNSLVESPEDPELARLRRGQVPDKVAAKRGADEANEDGCWLPWWLMWWGALVVDAIWYSKSPDSVLDTEPKGLFASTSIRWSSQPLGLLDKICWSSSMDHICWRNSSLCSVRNTTNFSVCNVLRVRKSGIVSNNLLMNSGWSGRFWLMMVCRQPFKRLYMRSINSRLRKPGRSGVIKTMAQNKPISASVKFMEFMRSAKLNVESTRKRALAPFCIASRRITWPFRQIMLLMELSNMQIKRTNRASKRPAFSRVNLSSCESNWKPGIMPAKSMTPRMTWAKRCENSCSDCNSGAGFKGQACKRKTKKIRNHIVFIFCVVCKKNVLKFINKNYLLVFF